MPDNDFLFVHSINTGQLRPFIPVSQNASDKAIGVLVLLPISAPIKVYLVFTIDR